MKYTSMRGTPARYTSIRDAPVRYTSMRDTLCEIYVYEG
jgi:hypothetical protein